MSHRAHYIAGNVGSLESWGMVLKELSKSIDFGVMYGTVSS